jgi:hypothetical protein
MALCPNCNKKVAVNSDRSQLQEEQKMFKVHAHQVEWAKGLCWQSYFPDRKCHEKPA